MSTARTIKITYYELGILKEQLDIFKKGSEETKLELHAKISLLIYKNHSYIDKKYFEYEKLRQQISINHLERDEEGNPIVNEETKDVKFKDEDALNKELTELLSTVIEVKIISPDMRNVERKIETLSGEQKVLEQLWYLLDVFENFKKD